MNTQSTLFDLDAYPTSEPPRRKKRPRRRPGRRTVGEQLRDLNLRLHELQRPEIIKLGRRLLLEILLADGTATIDDVRERIEIPAGINPVCLGAVPRGLVRAGVIESAGATKSTRPETHARPVTVWKLRDREKALQWMEVHRDV